MTRVDLSSPARRDLDAIWDYVARDNAAAADRLIDEIYQHCHTYATQPAAGTPADQFQVGLRFFAYGSYVVFYRAEDDGMLVIRIIHGARNLDVIFNFDA